MDPDRFEALAGAFGGDLGRWPSSEREAAYRLAAARPALAERLLGEARRLDRALSAPPAISANRQLLERIVGAAPRPRATRPRAPRPRAVGIAWRWLAGLGLTAGLAAAAAAGVAAAALLAPAALAPPRGAAAPDPVEAAALLLREPSEPGEV